MRMVVLCTLFLVMNRAWVLIPTQLGFMKVTLTKSLSIVGISYLMYPHAIQSIHTESSKLLTKLYLHCVKISHHSTNKYPSIFVITTIIIDLPSHCNKEKMF